MQKRIFISRQLKANSPFLTQLPKEEYEVVGCSLLEFSGVPVSQLPSVDWIFFYSQKAVTFFFESIHPNDLQVKYAAFGKGTAKVLEQMGLPVDFCGTGDGATTADAFQNLAIGKRVLFPRAQHSQKTIQRLLSQQLQVHDLVVYNNVPKTDFNLPPMDILIFTSPMNATTYFGRYQWKISQKVLAIGATTGQALKQLGVATVAIAPQASEAALVKMVLHNGNSKE